MFSCNDRADAHRVIAHVAQFLDDRSAFSLSMTCRPCKDAVRARCIANITRRLESDFSSIAKCQSFLAKIIDMDGFLPSLPNQDLLQAMETVSFGDLVSEDDLRLYQLLTACLEAMPNISEIVFRRCSFAHILSSEHSYDAAPAVGPSFLQAILFNAGIQTRVTSLTLDKCTVSSEAIAELERFDDPTLVSLKILSCPGVDSKAVASLAKSSCLFHLRQFALHLDVEEQMQSDSFEPLFRALFRRSSSLEYFSVSHVDLDLPVFHIMADAKMEHLKYFELAYSSLSSWQLAPFQHVSWPKLIEFSFRGCRTLCTKSVRMILSAPALRGQSFIRLNLTDCDVDELDLPAIRRQLELHEIQLIV